MFHIYGKGRLTTNDPIRYGDEVALFYRINDDGDGLWLGCASGQKRCGLGTCPGFPHLNHWMWDSKHSCDDNKFVVTGAMDLQNNTLSGQPVRIEHQIKLVKKSNYLSITSGKRHMGENSSMLIETPFLDNLGNWVINKGTWSEQNLFVSWYRKAWENKNTRNKHIDLSFIIFLSYVRVVKSIISKWHHFFLSKNAWLN